MSETSPKLDLPLIMPAQAQKHVPVNEALLRLDSLVQMRVESRSQSAQPATSPEGAAWIMPSAPSGADWSAFDEGEIAIHHDGAWTRLVPQEGWRAFIADESAECIHASTGWRNAPMAAVICEGEEGAATQAVIAEQTLSSLTGASAVAAGLIPERAVVFCVSVTVSAAVTGATSFDCGIAGETGKFGGLLGTAQGASNIGVIGPTAFYADTDVVLTANGGDFTGGEVRIAVHAWLPKPPGL